MDYKEAVAIPRSPGGLPILVVVTGREWVTRRSLVQGTAGVGHGCWRGLVRGCGVDPSVAANPAGINLGGAANPAGINPGGAANPAWINATGAALAGHPMQ
mmetsp:Transcript_9080/g.19528  ORF Transcript_9080/g.19528 Transcript_9080/m.19528 type:complete len:101 (+) Transcript_9080:513-815(+)